jgi:general secretion pathway protein J
MKRAARPRLRLGAGGGFTLIEMLVALLILAIMSALGYNTYRSASIAALRAKESLDRTREIEFGLRIMAQDFTQAVPRPIRDPLGTTREPSLRAGLGKPTLVDLTRGGWSNTAGMQRSTLQRVSYQLVGDTFKRSYLTVLDPTQNTVPVVQDLLTGVTKVTLSYLDANQVWNTQWPPATLISSESLWTRPVAVEIIIEFKDWGRVRRLVEIAG